MKIIIAPDSFKGSLSAREVSDSIAIGVVKVFSDADIIKIPMADGGEGTVRSLVDSTGGEMVHARVRGPLMDEVEACYGILGDGATAVIEMAEATGLEEKIKGADLVITGEGMMDYQTQYGKTPFGVAQAAKKYGIPVVAIVGSVGRNAEVLYDMGFYGIFSIVDRPMTLIEAMTEAPKLLERTSESVMRLIAAFRE